MYYTSLLYMVSYVNLCIYIDYRLETIITSSAGHAKTTTATFVGRLYDVALSIMVPKVVNNIQKDR